MLEYLQPLPHPFYASDSNLEAERDWNVIVVIERAELLTLVCGAAGQVFQRYLRLLAVAARCPVFFQRESICIMILSEWEVIRFFKF